MSLTSHGRLHRRRHGPLATRWVLAVVDDGLGFWPLGWHVFRWAADRHARACPRCGDRPTVVLSAQAANRLRAMAADRLMRMVERVG